MRNKATELFNKYYKGYRLTIDQGKELAVEEYESIIKTSISELTSYGNVNILNSNHIAMRVIELKNNLKDFKNEIEKL